MSTLKKNCCQAFFENFFQNLYLTFVNNCFDKIYPECFFVKKIMTPKHKPEKTPKYIQFRNTQQQLKLTSCSQNKSYSESHLVYNVVCLKLPP